MKPISRHKNRRPGFALIVTLSLMILLTVIAVGLLTLSSISLRSSTAGQANAQAFANARMAVMLAIGDLQKYAGDDRRITADASISPSPGQQANLVGVWKSWSPNFAAAPTQTAPDYATQKNSTSIFQSWLASSPTPNDLARRAWGATVPANDWVRLFNLPNDGFELKAPSVRVPRGTYAWIVSQEGTKAKVNVAGPEINVALPNVELQAQARPSIALDAKFKQPQGDWNIRSQRVISLNQIRLDKDMVSSPAPTASAASYTTQSQGLLTDALRGGLKIDLNLGFELSDADFAASSWNGTSNPFRSGGRDVGFTAPSAYSGQQPLFNPLRANPIVETQTNFDPANVAHRFFAAGVPTFDHLRSFYRIPHHLYGSAASPVVAERGQDHVAITVAAASGSSFWAPSNPQPTTLPGGSNSRKSVTGIRPVFNRLIYLFRPGLDSSNRLRLNVTPVISLWNPYNTSLEIEGAVVYPWIDMPFRAVWTIRSTTGNREVGLAMSKMMGKQFESRGHGRSVDPFFFCEISGSGTGGVATPIRFEPGEVRLFVPSTNVPIDFVRTGSNAVRTVRMRPVADANGLNTQGGLSIPMTGGGGGDGINPDFIMKQGDNVSLRLQESSTTGQFHYFVSMEDASRVRNPSNATRGQALGDVQNLSFTSAVNSISSPLLGFNELKNVPQPFGLLETYQRVAKQGINSPGGLALSDLVYTTNPRQPSINHQLAVGDFKVAPHYVTTLRSASSFGSAVETTGRTSLWGASHATSTGGRDHLPFFEIPRQPLLSLAGFQHADLSSSTFSSANQFANSWASPYLATGKVAMMNPIGAPIYDTVYLTNEALWDGFFFSGIAPVLVPGSSSTPASAWTGPIASERKSLKATLTDFVGNPSANPLANSRMRLIKGRFSNADLVSRLQKPEACALVAAHLTVDGAFNVNSTSVEAWTAVLAGLRGKSFEVQDGSSPSSSTAFPRFRYPIGTVGDNWKGFRSLNDTQLKDLASGIVDEVRLRGPFLSLAEFVNRRVDGSNLARSGTIQAAIDKISAINNPAKQSALNPVNYPADAKPHIIDDTGVGIPGYLTQADVLQSLAPVITCRSDTFVIRGYGEARSGNTVLARAWCEAVVQRVPGFVDPSNPAETRLSAATPVNQTFGRRYEIISFRRISPSEITS